MENFLDQVRPPEEMRSKLDVNYDIDGQSIVINELHPRWDNKDDYQEYGVAKATYNRSKNEWKSFWRQASLFLGMKKIKLSPTWQYFSVSCH
jgi:hypothetical protein